LAVKSTPRRAAFSRCQFTTQKVNGLERDVYLAGRVRPVFRISQRWGHGAGWWVRLPNEEHMPTRYNSINSAIMAGSERL